MWWCQDNVPTHVSLETEYISLWFPNNIFTAVWIVFPGNSAEGVTEIVSFGLSLSGSSLTFILAFFIFRIRSVQLCSGCRLSLVLKSECWPSCMALLSCWDNCGHCGQWPCHSTLRWMHGQMLESIHVLILLLICYLLLRPGHLWHPQYLGEEVSAVALRKERDKAH